MNNDIMVIFILSIFVYIIGICSCAYCLSSKKEKGGCCDKCFKYIKKYNCFGNQVDDDPRIYYTEV